MKLNRLVVLLIASTMFAQTLGTLTAPSAQADPPITVINGLALSGAQQTSYASALATRNTAIGTAVADWTTQKATIDSELLQGAPSSATLGAAIKSIKSDAAAIQSANDIFRASFLSLLTPAQKSALLGAIGL